MLLYADFNKMKIVKDYTAKEVVIELNEKDVLSADSTIAAIKQTVEKQISLVDNFTYDNDFAVCYTFNISNDTNNKVFTASDEEIDAFSVVVNIVIATIFNKLITKDGRKRERRLDVPDELKPLNCNLSLVKNAINYKTLVDKINININYKDLFFLLVDERELLDSKEFVHSIDEAPELKEEAN